MSGVHYAVLPKDCENREAAIKKATFRRVDQRTFGHHSPVDLWPVPILYPFIHYSHLVGDRYPKFIGLSATASYRYYV